jgi:hypothetical protein
MTERLETKLEIKSWDEQPYRELPDGRKFTRAKVEFAGAADGVDLRANWEALLYYEADGTSSYVGLMHMVGELAERSGSFVLQGSGTFDGTSASGESSVVPGSGTGDLSGLTGTMRSVSTHADYPFMPIILEYQPR